MSKSSVKPSGDTRGNAFKITSQHRGLPSDLITNTTSIAAYTTHINPKAYLEGDDDDDDDEDEAVVGRETEIKLQSLR